MNLKIAQHLRGRRYENGCLALNQVKINFVLNKECGLPYGYNVFQQKDSNRFDFASNFSLKFNCEI